MSISSKIEAQREFLRRMTSTVTNVNVFEEAAMFNEENALNLLRSQFEDSIDGDGVYIGDYEPKTKEKKLAKGTWRGWAIKLVDDATPFGKHWKNMIFVRVEDGEMMFDEDKVYSESGKYLLTDYIVGQTGWGKGRPEILELTEENKAILSNEIREFIKERAMK